MTQSAKQTLLWTPRILGILFILFISIFAFDVFDEHLGFWGTVAGLFLHLLPSIAFLVVVILAWRKWEWLGAVGFLGWTIFYIYFATVRGLHWAAYALVGGIPALIGLFFLAGWVWRKQIRE